MSILPDSGIKKEEKDFRIFQKLGGFYCSVLGALLILQSQWRISHITNTIFQE
jgi:hypothetical protein